jgi:hypothetical protein
MKFVLLKVYKESILSKAPKDLPSEFNELFLGVGVDVTVIFFNDESGID